MKANTLIQLLSTAERRHLEESVIKTHKRKSLQKLYAQLKKKTVPPKEVLFEAAFGKSYSSSSDAQLRNELRLLTTAIESFLIHRRQQARFQPNSYAARLDLLHDYLDRQAYTLVEQLWQRLYKQAIEQQEYQQQAELIEFWLDYRRFTQEPCKELFDELKPLVGQAQTATLAAFEEQYRYLNVYGGFVERNYLVFISGYEVDKLEYPYQHNVPLPNASILDYLHLFTQSYLHTGEKRIELLKQSFEYLPYLQQYPRYQHLVQRSILAKASIALEHFIKKEYNISNDYYQDLLPSIEHLPNERKADVYFNYLFNLLCLGEYQAVIDLYKQEGDELFSGHRFEFRIHYPVSWAYILMGQDDLALGHLLQHNLQERPQNDLVYGRVLLSILYTMSDEQELAERELFNLRQKHYYMPFNEESLVIVTRLFHRLAQLRSMPPSKRRQRTALQLQQEMDAYYKDKGEVSSTLFYRWFTQMVNALLD